MEHVPNTPAALLALQAAAGNAAVTQLVQRQLIQRMPLYHYTDRTGYDAILASQTLRPSMTEGKRHTHYGRGIYFTDLDPHFDASYRAIKGMAEEFFGGLTEFNRPKLMYYIEIEVDENLYPMQVVNWDEPKKPYWPRIWIVEQDTDMPIKNRILDHGRTHFQQVADLPPVQELDPVSDPREKPVQTNPEHPQYLGINWAGK